MIPLNKPYDICMYVCMTVIFTVIDFVFIMLILKNSEL
jgi:hypothetical protein